LGCLILVLADLVLAWAVTPAGVFVGAALWGLHMGLTEGIFLAMVANAAPSPLRGTAFGVFNLLRGVVLLGASVIAGCLWAEVGPVATFLAGASLAATSLVLLCLAPLARETQGKVGRR